MSKRKRNEDRTHELHLVLTLPEARALKAVLARVSSTNMGQLSPAKLLDDVFMAIDEEGVNYWGTREHAAMAKVGESPLGMIVFKPYEDTRNG